MSEGNNKYPPMKKNILNENKIKLYGVPLEGSKRAPTLSFSVIANMPRMTVFFNDNANNRATAAMAPGAFFTFLEMVLEVCNAPADTLWPVYNFTGPPNEKIQVSTTYVGKDQKGQVYVSIGEKDKPKTKFIFRADSYHHIKDKSGEDLSEALVSTLVARAWVRMLGEFISQLLVDNFVERDTRPQGGGRQYSQSRSSGSNNSAYADDFGDDLPLH